MNQSIVVEKKEIKKLIELNDELENYFRNTIIPQLFIDADLILRKFSPPAHKYFRFKDNDCGKHIEEIVSLKQVPSLEDCINEVIKTNQDLEKEIQINNKQWFQMNILPYIIKKQNITNGVVITFIDITDRINDKNDIERLNADHETFIYSVSHDFRGPLTNMILLIELLKSASDSNVKEEVERLIKMMGKSASDMKTMINELTDITKIETNHIDNPDSVNIESILEDVKFTLKDKIYQSHAKITTNITVAELIFPKKNLRSILYNLISNAIKFASSSRTPEILVRTEKLEGYTLLSVKDNGVGIEDDKQKEIFSKFTRLQSNVEGTGVGLYIVSKMISSHGGKIEVESKMDQGTNFKIFLRDAKA
jgi:two-component system, OmpR family, phosphate regulon sensor histidine kinase PhoR